MKQTITAFGEIMLRLSPTDQLLLKDAASFEACYGGSEANVLAALSAWGNPTNYISVIPENGVGDGAICHLKRLGIGTDSIARQGDTLGMYFLEVGFGARPSKVIYNRRHAAITEVDENAFDYDAVFQNCSIFHVCGISLALSEKCQKTALRFAKEARARGITVSFDFNYRSKLWSIDTAKGAYQAILPYVDICFGNTFDLSHFLDIDEGSTEASIEAFFKAYPARYLCYTEKKALSSTVNERRGVLWSCQNGTVTSFTSDLYRFEILDRIGAGDSFTAGVLHILNQNGADAEKAIRYGTACSVLKHTIKGDCLTLSEGDIQSFLAEKTKDVQR